MIRSKFKRPVAMLMAIIMLFSIAFLMGEDNVEAAGSASGTTLIGPRALVTSSILNNFVTSVVIEDMNGTVMNPAPPATPPPTYIGENYKFTIVFKETPTLQLEYDAPFPNGRLYYQLPSGLNIQNAVAQTPIQIGNGSVVGWYTIDLSGLVTVWFGNFDQNGAPSSTNYIDLTDVTITLEIFAQLTEDGGGDYNFGGNINVTIPPPVPPLPSLTMTKQSRYDPNTERIYYMITITALGAPVTNIWLKDTPSISVTPPADLSAAKSAFYGFRFDVNGSGRFTPMSVDWDTPSSGMFSYSFGDLSLAPDNFITVMYYLDIQQLIRDVTPPSTLTPLNYDFTINNTVTVGGDGVNDVTDNTVDRVKKIFPISKNGTYNSGANNIEWVVTIGDGTSTPLNNGLITDTLDSRLSFPGAANIFIVFSDTTTSTPSISLNDPQIGTYTLTPPTPNVAEQFSFTVPVNGTTVGLPTATIYQVEISYIVDVSGTGFRPDPGIPSINFQNNIGIEFPDGSGNYGGTGNVPITNASVNVNKTTSGICGNAATGVYYINYITTIDVPGGLIGQPLYIYDVLGLSPGGTTAVNVPDPITVTAALTDPPNTPLLDLVATAPIPYSGNSWRIFFGTAGATTPAATTWQYDDPVTLTVTYRINLDIATVNTLRNNSGGQLTNSVYLINSTGNPNTGSFGNAVGSKSVNDLWPIFKSSTPTANPDLFNYTVTIKGAYSSRPNALFQAGPPVPPSPVVATDAVFTDMFDSRLSYVPNSFYIKDTNTGFIYAPPPGTNIVTGNAISNVHLNTLQYYGSSIPDGTAAGTFPPPNPAWFARKVNYEVHYQLAVRSQFVADPQLNLENDATIRITPTTCSFNVLHFNNYQPNPLSKSLNTSSGTDLVKADIIINADGSVQFAPPTGPAPTVVTAKDTLQNLSIYMDTIRFQTQTRVGGIWNGVWTPVPTINFNDDIAWSVNAISPTEVDFVIPNGQPVRITYDALVTIPQGSTDSISNSISIYGHSSSDGDDSYQVNGSQAGAGGSALKLRLFKKDSINGFNLAGATFDLYMTFLPGFDAPLGLTDTLDVNGNTFVRLMQGVTTDMLGVALFDDIRITATYDYLFMLVETGIPPGYTPIGSPNPFESYTFFTIKPTINPALITAAEAAIGSGVKINQISDFINLENAPPVGQPLTLRIRKLFFEQDPNNLWNFKPMDMTDPNVLASFGNLEIKVTLPTFPLVTRTFTLQELVNNTAVLDISSVFGGVFMIDEVNNGRTNFTVRTNPQLPIRPYIWPDPTREIVIQITNIYNIPPHLLPPGELPPPSPKTGVRWNLVLPIALLSGAIVCIGGAEFYRRWHKKKKTQDQ